MSIFQNNSTQIITSDILLNEGGYIGENVTLFFQGGMVVHCQNGRKATFLLIWGQRPLLK